MLQCLDFFRRGSSEDASLSLFGISGVISENALVFSSDFCGASTKGATDCVGVNTHTNACHHEPGPELEDDVTTVVLHLGGPSPTNAQEEASPYQWLPPS